MRIHSFILSTTLIVYGFLFPIPSGAAETGLTAGKQAPAFELPDLSGHTVSLEQFKGKIVLLNFWSTLCAPCVAEMPSLNRLAAALKDREFEVVAVAIDGSDKPVRKFVAANKIGFTVLVDREKEVFFDDYAGPTLPATYLLDRNGTIIEAFRGSREWDSPDMKNRILKTVEKK